MIVAEGLGSILAICKPHYGVTAIKVFVNSLDGTKRRRSREEQDERRTQ
jgi:hypothetical protein